MTVLYLADVGFRPAGIRLAHPVRAALGERRLTLDELVATPEGTELSYHVAGLTGDEGYTSRQDGVTIRANGGEHPLGKGAFAFTADTSGLRRRISSASVIPFVSGPVEVAISIEGVGEFALSAQVMPFGPDTDVLRGDVNTSVTHEGITVTVRGVGAAREETAVEIEVAVGDGACCAGIGGYQGHRLGPTALTLRDESGRTYAERWQPPGRFDHATLALFQPVHPDARELELTVPYIFIEAWTTTEPISLPVTRRVDARLGSHTIGVLATSRIEPNRRASRPEDQEEALAVDLDLGGWNGDRRVVLLGRVFVDGDFCNVGSRITGMFNASRPEPVARLELTGERVRTAKTLAFAHPKLQVRGPWRIPIPLLR
jgi:hypothetical protein